MCGIAGIFGFGGIEDEVRRTANRMASALRHRGPDDEGIWIDETATIALVHRRLSIIDLSASGHQPMVSSDGRLVLIFNGEIYNHVDIRAELQAVSPGIQWRGHSDTETLVEAVARWGLEKTLARLLGMYAFAMWDRDLRRLYLVRDRLGEKPLYYGRVGRSFVFASELKGMTVHPRWTGDVDRGALALYMRHNYVPSPYCIYAGISKLPPASILTISSPDQYSRSTPRRYWSPLAAASNGLAEPETEDESAIQERLEQTLRDAVRRQLQADVPLGAFLSGGVDSSTVVALMQSESTSPIRTFSIGFHEDAYDEAQYARRVAAHLQTAHTELYVTPSEAMAVVPRLPTIYDEPFADPSQVPTFLVSQLARTQVTVSLSGDGGDELFGGYNRYFWSRDLWRIFRWIPAEARLAMAKAIEAIPPGSWDYLYTRLSPSGPRRHKLFGDKLHKLAEVMPARTPEEMYARLVSHWRRPEDLVLGARALRPISDPHVNDIVNDTTLRMMLLDTTTYLPDDILVKLDRASMAVSLESRVPFLDHRLVEYAWRIPLRLKIDGNVGKVILRKILYRFVPRELIERPKQGFALPIDTWLRGPLREWGESLLSQRRLREDGYLDPELVRTRWAEHLSGKRNWQYLLWGVLMWQEWLEHQRSVAVRNEPVAAVA